MLEHENGAALSVVAEEPEESEEVATNVEATVPLTPDASLRLSVEDALADEPALGMGVTAQLENVLVTADLATGENGVAASATTTWEASPGLTVNADVEVSEEVSVDVGATYAAEDEALLASVQVSDVADEAWAVDAEVDALKCRITSRLVSTSLFPPPPWTPRSSTQPPSRSR